MQKDRTQSELSPWSIIHLLLSRKPHIFTKFRFGGGSGAQPQKRNIVMCRFFRGFFGKQLPKPMKECRDHSENLINRKFGKFYIDIDTQKIFQLRKNFVRSIWKKKVEIFWSLQKIFFDPFFFGPPFFFIKNQKCQKWNFQKFRFFCSTKKIYFFSWKKNLGIYIDAELIALSIGEVSTMIRARQVRFPEHLKMIQRL